MRYLLSALLAVLLAASASAQPLLSATFTGGPEYAVANDDPNTPYVTTPRTKGYSNEVGLSSSGTLYFRILQPDVLKRTINLDFSNRVSGPSEATPCQRFGSVSIGFYCTLPPFLTPPVSPGPAPTVIFSWINTTYEWLFKDSRWVRREEPDRKGKLQPVLFDFSSQGVDTTRYAVLNWQLRFDEGTGDPYTYWLVFSNTWLKALNEQASRVGIVAIYRKDPSTWVLRPIDPSTDGALPGGMMQGQALLTQYVLADEDSCASGVGAHCYQGDFLMPFELTLKALPKVR